MASLSKEEMGKVFEQTNAWFKTTPNYSLTVTHASFENYTTEIPYEKSTGYFKKQGENYHSFLLNIHTIQNKEYKIVIDSVDKLMLVANPDHQQWQTYTQEDYSVLLKTCTALRKSINGRYTFYKMELPDNSPIGAYEFLIDEQHRGREIRWYYNKEVKKDESDPSSAVKPRMNISFSAYKEEENFDYTQTFSESAYFEKKGDKLIPTEKYSKYKLLDQRIKK